MARHPLSGRGPEKLAGFRGGPVSRLVNQISVMANSVIQVGPVARQHCNDRQPATLTRNLHRRLLHPPTGIDIGPEYKQPFNGFRCPAPEDLTAGRSFFLTPAAGITCFEIQHGDQTITQRLRNHRQQTSGRSPPAGSFLLFSGPRFPSGSQHSGLPEASGRDCKLR